eukprot:2810391-Pleurochrysis_carterae.AAC.3
MRLLTSARLTAPRSPLRMSATHAIVANARAAAARRNRTPMLLVCAAAEGRLRARRGVACVAWGDERPCCPAETS